MDPPRRILRSVAIQNGVVRIEHLEWNPTRNSYDVIEEEFSAYENNNRNLPLISEEWQPSMVFVPTSEVPTALNFLPDVENQNRLARRRRNLENQQQYAFENLERIVIGEGAPRSQPIVCSICLMRIPIGSEAIRLPYPCTHVYHQGCILRWLNMSNTCPICRRFI